MEWAKQAAAQAKQLRERAAQEASKLQESYKDGTLASPLAERLSLDAVSASLKEGRQKLREGVETAIEAGADASRRTMDAMGENERVDEVIKSKNARILALEEERAKHRHALAEAVKAAKQKAEELDLVKERAVARFKVLQDEKTQSDGARAALRAELDRLRAAAPAPPLIDLAAGGGGGRDDDDFDSPASARPPPAAEAEALRKQLAERDAALADLREKGREMLTALQAEKAALAHQLSEATTARQAAEAAVANASSAQQAEAAQLSRLRQAHAREIGDARKAADDGARARAAEEQAAAARADASARRRRRRSGSRRRARRARRSCARGTRRRRRTWRRR